MTLLLPPVMWSLQESNIPAQPAPNAMGTSVTAHATPHTKGNYVELIASTAFPAYEIDVLMSEVATTNTDTGTLVDIAIGGAGSEIVLIPDLNAGHASIVTSGAVGGQRYRFPIYIPAGSRIAARSQALITVDTVTVAVILRGGPSHAVWAGSTVTAYGVDAANSQGTSVTAATGAEGAWTELVASTTAPHPFWSMGVANSDNTSSGEILYVDLGVGAAAAEAAIGEDVIYVISAGESLSQIQAAWIWAPAPSGARLAARIRGVGASVVDVIGYGVS